MPLRPCLDCAELTTTTRCAQHTRAHQRRHHQAKRARRPYTYAERKRREAAVARHIQLHGHWCPGWDRPPHPATDLTADHLTPVATGGPEGGPLGVLCRSCNSRKQDQLATG